MCDNGSLHGLWYGYKVQRIQIFGSEVPALWWNCVKFGPLFFTELPFAMFEATGVKDRLKDQRERLESMRRYL